MVRVAILLGLGILAACSSAPAGKKGAPPRDPNAFESVTESTPAEIEAFSQTSVDSYVIGPSDTLLMHSDSGEFPDETLKVTSDGRVNISHVGWVTVGHLELSAAEKAVAKALKDVYTNGTCTLIPETTPSRSISVLGSVRTPGVLPMESQMTLVDAISRAGGLVDVPGDKRLPTSVRILCRVVRSGTPGIWVDLRRVLFGSEDEFNVILKASDIVYVYKP